MRVVFRADASSTIGFGHLSRAVALGMSARGADVDVVIVSARPSPPVRSFIDRAGIALVTIDADAGTSEDASATATAAGPTSCIVVDGYVFGAGYLDALRGRDRIVAWVDDFARDPLPCDVVINPNVSASPAQYEWHRGTSLVGPEFAIVHDRFVSARASSAKRDLGARPEKLLVTMGGSDPAGATLQVVASLDALDVPKMQVRVVVGMANERLPEIQAAVAACTKHDVRIRLGVEDMASEMLWSDVALTASGVTATELACIGVPGVTFPTVDNQDSIGKAFGERGMFRALPRGSAGSEAMLRALEEVIGDPNERRRMIDAQRRTIDGKGKVRIVDALLASGAFERHTPRPSGGERG